MDSTVDGVCGLLSEIEKCVKKHNNMDDIEKDGKIHELIEQIPKEAFNFAYNLNDIWSSLRG